MVSRQVQPDHHDSLPWLGLWGKKVGVALLVIIAAIIAYFIFQNFLRIAATVLLLATMFTYLLQPIVNWLVRNSRLKNQHAARIAATLITYVALAIFLYVVGASITRAIVTNVRDLQITWSSVHHTMPQELARLQQWYVAYVPEVTRTQVAESLQREMSHVSDKYVPEALTSLLGLAKRAGQTVAFLFELIFVPLLAFYFITDAEKLREQTLFFVPKRHRTIVMRYASELDRILRRYVHSQLILCVIAWAVVTLALLIMRIPGALLLGIIAGVSRAIPIIGPLIGGVPVLTAVLINPHWSGAVWWVLIGFVVLHFFESKFLMPRILGDHLGVHPVIVILSLLIGYEMLGLLGMFLAPPAIAMVRFLLATHRNESHFVSPEQPGLPGLDSSMSDQHDK